MAHHWSEGVSTLRFTAREFQQDLVEEALKHNLLTCPPTLAATFVALKVIQELAYQIRRPSRKKTAVLSPIYRIKDTTSEISHLSDLVALSLISIDDCKESLDLVDNCEVIVCTTEVFEYLLCNDILSITMINLLIVEECHMVTIDEFLQKIISRYLEEKSKQNNQRNLPRILAFTYPLFTNCDTKNSNNAVHDIKGIIEKHSENMPMDRATLFDTSQEKADRENPYSKCLKNFIDLVCLETDSQVDDMNSFKYWSVPFDDLPVIENEPVLPESKDDECKSDNQDVLKTERTIYDKLEYQLDQLESMLFCDVDMASDIVGLKRITGKPKEVVVECKEMSEEEKSHDQLQLEAFMKSTVAGALIFLDDHRYDPTEIYGDEAFGEELRAIPDPRTEPREMLELFLYILEEAGPYAADKAAFILLIKIEKLKIKIPYERHFLLLCLITSIFIQIRAAAEFVFRKYITDKEKISKFSTPKICRLLDILRLFKPSESMQKGLQGVSNKGFGEKKKSTEETSNSGQNKKSDPKKKSSNSGILKKSDCNPSTDKCQSSAKRESDAHFQNSNPKSNDIDSVRVQDTPVDSPPDNSTQNVCQKKCDNISSASSKANVKNLNSNPQTVLNSELSSNICDKILDNDFVANESSDSEKSISKNLPILNGSIEQIDNCDFIELEHKIQINCDKLMSNESANNNKNIIKNLKKIEKTSVEHNITLSTSPPKVTKGKKQNKSDGLKQNKKHDNMTHEKSVVTVKTTNDSPCKKTGDGNFRGRGRGRGGKYYGFQGRYYNQNNDPDALCGLIFVNEPLIAKILSTLINEYCRSDDDLMFVCAQYTVDKIADPVVDPKEAETEHKLQEEVLKRFRIHECNLLVGTSILEEGMDLPKCNLVIRWDLPNGYRSYARCRARARAPRSIYAMLVKSPAEQSINMLAHFSYIERMLVKKCGWYEPPASEEADAARFSSLIEPYRPAGAAVNLSSAVALLNRYCVKLPSDTFTRLVPLWSTESVNIRENTLYICTIRLPINCPLKHHIVGHPMPNRVLARRVAALQACRALHKAGELDDNLMPIGKEGFRATESDWLSLPPASDLPKSNPKDPNPQIDTMDSQSQFDFASSFEPRPGTTKRKQYYYKKVAHAFSGCRPSIGKPCLAYYISAWLACPLPERHNTRGRKLHPPEAYAEGFAILTSKPIQQIPVFPIFTRSGEVRVALEKLPFNVMISHRRRRLIHYFMKYTFAEVLRVHNHLMIFDESGKQNRNSYYIVPTLKVSDNDGNTSVIIDWNFLQLIYDQTNSETLSYDPSNINLIESEENSLDLIENNEMKSDCEKTICENCCMIIESVTKNSNNSLNKTPKNLICKNNELIENGGEIDLPKNNVKVESNENEVKNHSTKHLCNKCLNDNEKNGSATENSHPIENEHSNDEVKNNDDVAKVEATPLVLPNPYLSQGETFIFDSEKYRDAVVMPWYRNQDQPQYFYVAEICWHLSPRSAFPSEQHDTFEEYYKHKYGVRITQSSQPLLDVDHTSARLNLLTPRFVNRKGVALPTSSERTKRAKRESLEQKQILVPELCCTHPFRGALWRAAVALPCILYRINSLLLADEIRKSVALRVALGVSKPEEDFKWPALDFGWSLAEVLAGENAKELKTTGDSENKEDKPEIKVESSETDVKNENDGKEGDNEVKGEKTANEILKTMEDAEDVPEVGAFEIGTWSNDMAATVPSGDSESQDYEDDELISATAKLPGNLTICTPMEGGADWSLSPSNPPPTPKVPSQRAPQQRKYSMADSDASYVSSDFEESDDADNSSDSDSDDYGIEPMEKLSEKGGKHTIIYKSGNEAEAIEIPSIAVQKKTTEIVIDPEIQKIAENKSISVFQSYFYSQENEDEKTLQHIEKFKESIEDNKTLLKNNGILISHDSSLDHIKIQASVDNATPTEISTCSNTNKKISNETHLLSNNAPNCDSTLQSDQTDAEKPTVKVDTQENQIVVRKQNRFPVNNQLMIHKTNICDGLDNVNPFPELFDIALSKNEILQLYRDMFPYEIVPFNEPDWFNCGLLKNGCITLDNLELNKRKLLNEIKKCIPDGGWIKFNFFSMKDLDENDFGSDFPKKNNELKSIEYKHDKTGVSDVTESNKKLPMDHLKPDNSSRQFSFSFDHQPDLNNHPGPSPSLILQALTMSNANDGINLERLETIGDSFLKYAITTYLYCTYQNIHEGKLSHLRSKQVSNLNLYRLGRKKSLGSRMVAYKFEPHDNWLPPCHRVPPHLERALIDTNIPSSLWNIAEMPPLTGLSKDEIEKLVKERVATYHSAPANFHCSLNKKSKDESCPLHGKNKRNPNVIHEEPEKSKNETADHPKELSKCTCTVVNCTTISKRLDSEKNISELKEGEYVELEGVPCFVPYNLITQHSIPDKSVADCVEALIGAYLIECGPRGALLFMAWLGIRVLPKEEIVLSPDHPFVKMMESAKLRNSKYVNQPKNVDSDLMNIRVDEDDVSDDDIGSDCDQDSEKDYEVDPYDNQDENSDFDEDDNWNWEGRVPGSLKPEKNDQGQWVQLTYGELKSPPSPLLRYVPDPEGELMQMLSGYEGLEKTLGYRFKDRCYLLQAMTHASYSPNRLTDCYQRLEFLGDAVLDYLITRQLYEDPRRHSPGALTDLRSALVNNTIFASLAVRHGMHKYFRHLSPGLNEVLARFVKIQEENGHSISEEHYLIQEDECEQAEDVEVPKALGDLFESVAGAIFLDSGMSLDAVWKVYHALMQREIEAFSESVPKSPVRELLEMEPETAKFGKPEKLADGRRVRVTVEVLGAGAFKGVGRNYRIAKCTAAKCALRRLAPSGTRRHNK